MKVLRSYLFITGLIGVLLLASCASPKKVHVHYPVSVERLQFYEQGLASWYGPGFKGRRTASGERFNPKEMTCAHKKLPFGTWIRVLNVNNERFVDVRVNDRGPFIKGRVIDLSKKAAEMIDVLREGTASIKIFLLPSAGEETPKNSQPQSETRVSSSENKIPIPTEEEKVVDRE